MARSWIARAEEASSSDAAATPRVGVPKRSRLLVEEALLRARDLL
jgi:hypothetical protein